jgi:uncharacterized membrane protein
MERTDLGRIMAFTDGVMAVAITLLVLNLDVPQVPKDELGEALVDLVSSVLAYLLSFALVGRFWLVHHRLFETLRRFDDTLMALNLLFLAAIAIVPFSTNLYDDYTDVPLAVAVFGLVMGLAALTHWLMAAHTVRRNLVDERYVRHTAPFGSRLALAFTGIFLLSVPVAFVSVKAAQGLWLVTILLRYPLRRLTGTASSS